MKSTLQPKYSKDAINQGLLYKGDKELVYEPGGYNAKETTRESWPKSKTEQFIDDTKELSTLDFIDRVKEKLKLEGIPAIRETSNLVSNDENLMETLVREIKRNGGFSKLMQEVLGHQEAYTEIALLMSEEESVCNQLARAIRETTKIDETTDVPIKDEMGGDEDETPPEGVEGEVEGEVAPGTPTQPGAPQPQPGAAPETGQMPQTPMAQMRKRQHVMMRREHNLIKALQRYNII